MQNTPPINCLKAGIKFLSYTSTLPTTTNCSEKCSLQGYVDYGFNVVAQVFLELRIAFGNIMNFGRSNHLAIDVKNILLANVFCLDITI